MVKPLGSLKRLSSIEVREIWEHGEAQGFTPWLRDNIEVLSEAIGLELDLVQREVKVGNFSADLVAKDLNSDRTVVIENQLAPTNHGHLGQLLTYAAGVEAGVVVWISPEFREEHRQVLDWLNSMAESKMAFYGIELELLRVDNSKPALNLKVVSSPVLSEPEDSPSELGLKYQRFFTAFAADLKSLLPNIAVRDAQPRNNLSLSSGHAGYWFGAVFTIDKKFRIDFYIRPRDLAKGAQVFSALKKQKAKLSQEIGETLDWEDIGETLEKGRRISVSRPGTIEMPDDELVELQEWGVKVLAKFRKVFPQRLPK